MTITRRPLSRAQQFLLVASAVNVVIGWTYAAQVTKARSNFLDYLPFSSHVVGLILVALGVVAIIATFRHRGLRESIGWAAASAGPFMLTAIWTVSALIHTPMLETFHVMLTLAVLLAATYVAVRWARHRTGWLLVTIVVGLSIGWFITDHSQVTAWTAWSSALVYGGFCTLIYLGALATTPTNWGRNE